MNRICLVFLFTVMSVTQLFAQNEIQREISSLAGIVEMGVVVNIEKPIGMPTVEKLTPAYIREGIIAEFGDLPVQILTDRALRQSDEFPILHVHVNVMKASNNTYPFSIEMNFYQPVKLVLKGDLQSMASTWNKGQIGIVSENMLEVIVEEAIYTSRVFKEEFQQVN
jgi:hypothetical protein